MSPKVLTQESTMKGRILEYIRLVPHQSAYQIATALQYNASSVSAVLKHMTDACIVMRQPHRGPRGGYGYSMPE